MKITLNRPIYHGGTVKMPGTPLETDEQHGRTLVRKGYATAPQAEKPPPEPPGKPAKKPPRE